MYVLAIETSCDETAVSLLLEENGKVTIVEEEISSQTAVHEQYGGVVPELASREHLSNLPLLADAVMQKSGKRYQDLALVAVTKGPGLKGCLLIGAGFAKGLCLAHTLPMLGVNHIEGHIFAPWLATTELKFPYLCLVVSGGHTEIVEVQDLGRYRIVARTIDDAAGEAFDKAANLLGFAYPGGARLAALADAHRPSGKSHFRLPRVMRESQGFSFSGLKTAIALLVKKHERELADEKVRGDLAWAVQESIVDALLFKLQQALASSNITQVAVSGGVSANRYLRERVTELHGVKAFFPGARHCMDNASMIGYVGLRRFQRGERSTPDMDVIARWPVEEI